MESKTALLILKYLGKASHFFRPTTLDFQNQRYSVSVSGDVSTIHCAGRVDKGMIQWFASDGSLPLRTPTGLDLEAEVALKNTGQQADYRVIKPQALAIDIKKHLRERQEKWRNGEIVDFEIRIPCNTEIFLAFPRGEAGSQIIQDKFIETVIEVQKKSEYHDIVIANYEFRRTLEGLLPLESASVTKNGQEIPLRVDLVSTENCSVSIDTIRLDNRGDLDASLMDRKQHLRTRQPEIRIPMSFMEPHDKYIIEFRTNKI